jgi:hypothetical protein
MKPFFTALLIAVATASSGNLRVVAARESTVKMQYLPLLRTFPARDVIFKIVELLPHPDGAFSAIRRVGDFLVLTMSRKLNTATEPIRALQNLLV